MKVLFLSQGRKIEDHPSWDWSFRDLKNTNVISDYLNIPYIGYAERFGWPRFYQEVVIQNESFKPDVVLFQYYHSGGDEGIAKCCKELKSSTNKPLIFGSIGDPFYTGWRKYLARPLHKSSTDLAYYADAFFATSMGNVADELVKFGVKNLVFLPNSFMPEHFPYWEEDVNDDPKYDVMMLCSKGRLFNRRPVIAIQNNWVRRYVVTKLSNHFGDRFSVFGRNWKLSSALGCVPFSDQMRYYKRSRVVIDAPAPIRNTDYYSSNRAFFMLASGVPLVHFYTPRFEKILRPEEHAFYCYRLSDACNICERALSLPKDVCAERCRIIRKFVKERHLNKYRVDTIISTAEAINSHRRGECSAGEALRKVRMHHFLPEVNLEEEYQYCTRNWIG